MRQLIAHSKAINTLSAVAAMQLTCCILFCTSLQAQDIRFEHYTSQDGLPTNELYVTTESSDGYLWIGSQAGLTRFDGLSFKSLLHGRTDDLTLPGRSVQAVLADSNGLIWAGMEAGGLVQVDNNLNILRHYSTTTESLQLPNDTIWGMAEDCDGNIMLGFPGEGVARLNPENNTLESIPMLIPDTTSETLLISNLHVDRNCRVWVGLFGKGIMYLDESNNRFVQAASGDWLATDKSILSITSHRDLVYAAATNEIGIFDSLTSEYADKIDLSALLDIERIGINSLSVYDDTLWAATASGLYSIQLSIDPKSINNVADHQPPAEYSADSGYHIRHYQHQETLAGTLASNSLSALTTGENGNVWIASRDNGLIYKPPGWDNFTLLRRNPLEADHLPSNNIITNFTSPDQLWMGTFDAGLARYSYRQQKFSTPTTLKTLPFQRVWAIHIDRSGATWVAGNREILYKQVNADPVQVPLSDEITNTLRGNRPLGFIELEDSLWLIAKYRYLLRYDKLRQSWQLRETEQALQSITFTQHLPLSDSQFLISSESRLYRYDAHTDQFEVLLDVADDHIQQLTFDRQKRLWIAQKSGVFQYHLDTQLFSPILHLNYPETLLNTVINNLLFDTQGKLWIGSTNGLFKILSSVEGLENDSNPDFLHLTRSDGLPSSEMSANTLVQLTDGRMAIGTSQGQVIFDPRKIRPKSGRPRIDINGLISLEQDLPAEQLTSQPLDFDYDDNTISVRFNAVTFNNRDHLSYQYRMDGWDTDWINTSQAPQVTYSRLKHGSYTFNARARIGSGEWGEINDSLSFNIQRPPWVTWWAYSLYGTIAIFAAVLLQLRRRQASARRRALFQARERQQFAETQTRIATDFASAIHYEEIATTLSTTLKESMPMARMLVHFQDTSEPAHEFIYNEQWAREFPAKVDFSVLYAGFENNSAMRYHQQQIGTEEQARASATQLSLPLGAKRPVQAIACLQFPADTPPGENDVALASLVAQLAETAVHNTVLLEQVSQLAALNQRANDAKSEFISTVSHEIRTPLHGLMGMLDLLNNCEPGEQRNIILQRLTDSSEQLLAVVDDVLDISKIEANKVELHQDTFELDNVLEHVTQLFQDQASAKGLELHALMAPDTCGWWIGDKTRLVQILTNLVNNSIKFTPNGAVFIAVNEIHDKQKPSLQLTVADTGIGMSNEVIDSLFDEYQQAEDWTWKKYGGSGLGLSITKRLVELMGGRIEVTSAIGKGSMFHLFLPLDKPSILTRIERLELPHDFIVHLACDEMNDILKQLLSIGNQINCHNHQGLQLPASINQNEVLITTSAELAKQAQLDCALVYISAEKPLLHATPNIHAFRLSTDWDALLVWLISRTMSASV